MLPEKSSSGEGQKVKAVVSRQLGDFSSSDSGLMNRQERRRLEKSRGKVRGMRLPQFAELIPEDQILMQEDDTPFLEKEVALYQSAQFQTSMKVLAYNALSQLGVPDAICKKAIVNPDLSNMPNVASEIFRIIRTKDQKLIHNMIAAFEKMLDPRHKRFYGSDEADLISSLIEDDSINGRDILIEVMRARQESIGLMQIQIDWLKERQALASKQKRVDQKTDNAVGIDTGPEAEEELSSAILQNVPSELPEASADLKQEVKEQFLLEGWDLFITRSPWSSHPNHLTSIPTNSRQETLDAVTMLTQGKSYIKPNNILSALEFHLRKDVIQRALATRLKYGPDGIRDWVKISKRKDRIFFPIPDPDKRRAVFFVEGRDVVYRSI